MIAKTGFVRPTSTNSRSTPAHSTSTAPLRRCAGDCTAHDGEVETEPPQGRFVRLAGQRRAGCAGDDRTEELGRPGGHDGDGGRLAGGGGFELAEDAFPAEHVQEHVELATAREAGGGRRGVSEAVPLDRGRSPGEHAAAALERGGLDASARDAADHRAVGTHGHRGADGLRRAPEDVDRGRDRDALVAPQQRQEAVGELEHGLHDRPCGLREPPAHLRPTAVRTDNCCRWNADSCPYGQQTRVRARS